MIDSRILEMVFKNKEFEDGINDSLKSLDKLDRSLGKIDGSETSDALDKVGKVAEEVGNKFSIFEEIAKGALRRIGDRAADWAVNMAKSLSIDQLTEGWNKYEQKNTAMQTIMNNAHKENGEAYQLEEVNAQMEKLNWFTDETSYNFTDMVDNIGKFTSMGKSLEDSTTAMQGIAVWASSAGQGISEASRAMYNLSQAMGMGALTTIDFKSIENANMATEEFKLQAIQSGEAMGMLTKKIDEATGKYKYFTQKGTEVNAETFRSTLSEKWLDSYVLMDTLKEYGKFADELNEVTTKTGMSATDIVNTNKGLLEQYGTAADKMAFLTEYIKENTIEFEDEKYTVEDLAKALDKLNSEEYALSKKAFRAAQEYRTFNDAISATKDAVSTGWMNIFEQIVGNYQEAKAVWTQFGDDLYEIFGRGTEKILDILVAWRELEEFGETMGTRSALFDALHMLVATLFDVDYRFTSIAKVIHDAWQEIFPSSAEESAFRLANAIVWFSDKMQAFQDFISRNAEQLGNIFKGIFGFVKLLKTLVIAPLKMIITIVKSFTGGLGDSLVNVLGNIGQKVYEFSEKWSGKIEAFFSRMTDGILKVKQLFSEMIDPKGFKTAIGTFGTAFEEFKSGNFAKGIATALAYITLKVRDFIDVVKEIKDSFVDTFSWLNKFKDNWEGRGIFEVMGFEDWTIIEKITYAVWKTVQRVKLGFESVRGVFAKFVDLVKGSKTDVSEFFTTPATMGERFKKVISAISKMITKLINKIKDLKKAEGPFKKLADFFKNVGKILSAIWLIVKEALGGIIDKFNEFFNVKSVHDISTILKNILQIVKTGGLIAIITSLLKMFKKANKTLDTVKDSLSKVFSSLSDAIGSWKRTQDVKTIKEVAASLLILAAALYILSTIDTDKLLIGVGVMSTMLFVIAKFLKSFAKTATEFVKYKAAAKMIAKIGIAMLLLAFAVKVMGSLDWQVIVKGVGGISVLFLVLSIFMKSIQRVDPLAIKSVGTMLTKMALAIRILIWSVERLGKLKMKELVKGVGGISVLLIIIGIFTRVVSKANPTAIKKAGGMILMMAISMIIFSKAIERMGNIKTKVLKKGLAAMAIVFVEIAAFMTAIRKSGNMISAAFSMILLATALNILFYAVRNFGQMKEEELKQGLIATGVALAEFVIALNLIDGDAVLKKAAALLVISAAILVLVPAIEAFGHMKMAEIGKALLTLLGIMAIFVASMYALAPISSIVMTAAGAFALFGVAILAVGAGLMLTALAIAMLVPIAGEAVLLIGSILATVIAAIPLFLVAVATGIVQVILTIAASVDAIIAAVVMVISGVLVALMALVPQVLALIGIVLGGVLDLLITYTPTFLEWLGILLAGLLQILTDNTPTFMLWLNQIITGLLQILTDNTPTFFTWIGQIIDGVLTLLNDNTPKLFDLIRTLLDEAISILVEYIPKIANAGLDIFLGLLHAIDDHMEEVVVTALSVVENFLKGIAQGIPGVIDQGFKVVIAFINGMADAIRNNNEALFDAINNLLESIIQAIMNFFKGAWKRIKTSGKNLMEQGFIKGIKEKIDDIKSIVGDIVDKIKNWFKNKWEDMKEIGGNLIEGLKSGMKNMGDKIKDTVTDVAGKVTGWFKNIFGIESPSKVFAEMGRYNMMGLAKGFVDNENLTEAAAEKVGEDTMDAFGEAMSKVYDSLDDNMDMSPTITPVLDLSNIQNGSRNLDSMFGSANVGLTASSYNASRQAQAAQQNQSNANMAQALRYYTDKMVAAINSQSSNTDVKVTLEGDAAGIFRAVRTQNDRYKVSTGRSALI